MGLDDLLEVFSSLNNCMILFYFKKQKLHISGSGLKNQKVTREEAVNIAMSLATEQNKSTIFD